MMEVFFRYKSFGVRYCPLTGTTFVEKNRMVLASYDGYGKDRGRRTAVEYIDSIAKQQENNMDDAEYKKLWAMIDDAHTRIGYLESERDMLVKAIKEVLDSGDDRELTIAKHSAKQLLETMKGE